MAAEYSEGMCNKLARDFECHLKENGHQKVPPAPGTLDEAPCDPVLKDLMGQYAGAKIATPKFEQKTRLLTKKLVTEKENRACAGGLRDPAAFVRSSEEARTAGARLRRCLDDVLRQPDVLEEMLHVVDTLGTESCATPKAAIAEAMNNAKSTASWTCLVFMTLKANGHVVREVLLSAFIINICRTYSLCIHVLLIFDYCCSFLIKGKQCFL